MKKYILIACFIFSATFIFAQGAQINHFTVKSGHVEFTLSGSTVGTKSIWFDDYGNKYYELVESVTTVDVLDTKSVTKRKTLTIKNGDDSWTVDYIENTGVYENLKKLREMIEEMSKAKTEAEWEAYGKKMIEELGGEFLGTEVFLGKTCDVYTLMGGRFLMYKGLVLKSTVDLLDSTDIEAASLIEENIAVAASKFEKPVGITFVTAPDLYGNDE